MPRPKGKTRVLTPEEIDHAIKQIENHRYPEKNKAILLMSVSMGLTAQEIARIRIQDVAKFAEAKDSFTLLKQITVRPKQQSTAHDDAMRKNHNGFNVDKEQLNAIIRRVAADALNDKIIKPSDYYPEKQRYQRAIRILPLYCSKLNAALHRYLEIRLKECDQLDLQTFYDIPLFLNQKRKAYSANTLQEHIKLMLAVWAGISGATSLSGRATLTNNLLKAGVPIKDVQKFLGHVSASTTVLYQAPNSETEHLTYDLRKIAF